MINRYSFDDLQIGMSDGYSARVTEEMMDSFLSITGDVNPLHTDESFSVSVGMEGRVVYGMLTAAFLSTLAGVYLPGERSLIQSVEVKFVRPVHLGDLLNVKGTIIELHDNVRQIVVKVEIRNQDGVKVLRGLMKVGMLGENG